MTRLFFRPDSTEQHVSETASAASLHRVLAISVGVVLLGVGVAAWLRRRVAVRPPPVSSVAPPEADAYAALAQIWRLNAMGGMASILAHKLNQPLSAISNYLRAARNQIARMELQDDDLLDAVARAGDQSVRAGEILRAMRDLATRGGEAPRPESLSAILGEIDVIISLMARDADVRICHDLYHGDDTVMADRVQIQQLIVNLVRNAVEAVSNCPNREINISTRPDADGQLITMVEDSGLGIDPRIAEHLFQPLASEKPQGMGLGLSISSVIVENHRGRIWVEPSRLGGAAFCFVLGRAGIDGDVSD